jgi:hypothetical protein
MIFLSCWWCKTTRSQCSGNDIVSIDRLNMKLMEGVGRKGRLWAGWLTERDSPPHRSACTVSRSLSNESHALARLLANPARERELGLTKHRVGRKRKREDQPIIHKRILTLDFPLDSTRFSRGLGVIADRWFRPQNLIYQFVRCKDTNHQVRESVE